MGQALRLALTYLRVGVMNEVQYRANFFIQILQSAIALAVGLIGLYLVFGYTTDLNGWSQGELTAVLGVYTLMSGLIGAAIQPNMNRLLEEIREGTLDYALTKPADSQVIVSVREFRLWRMVDVVVGLVVIGVAIVQLGGGVGPIQVLSFVAAVIIGALMIYGFWIMLTASAFWFIRIDEMVNLFEGIYAAGRWPVSIYPGWLRYSLTFLIPVAFAVTVPAEALTGRLNWLTLAGAVALAATLLLAARFIWKKGVKNYSGASA